MLNEEIKNRIDDKLVLREADESMSGIWKRHAEAHAEAFHAAGRLHTFLSTRIHDHGLSHEIIAADPDSHKEVFDKIHHHGVSMTMKEKRELEDHVNRLKDAQAKRDGAVQELKDHPRYKPTISGAIFHGAFGASKKSLSSALEDKKNEAINDMERHSELDPNSREAHALRRKHGADYEAKPPAQKNQKEDSDDDDSGVIKRAASHVGSIIKNAALDTMRNPNTSRKGRR